MASRFFIILIYCALSATITVTGCGTKSGQLKRQRESIVQASGELYKGYLKGDIARARRCLLDAAKQVEDATILEPRGRAQLLRETYYRLYALEKRCGNEAASEADLVKARYWALKYGDLIGLKIEAQIEQLQQDTPERIITHVDDSDRGNNDGKKSEYLQSLNKR